MGSETKLCKFSRKKWLFLSFRDTFLARTTKENRKEAKKPGKQSCFFRNVFKKIICARKKGLLQLETQQEK